MLQKRINKGSIPYGGAVAGVDLVKGTLVQLTFVDGVETAAKPASVAAGVVDGFAFLTVRDDEGTYQTNDTIKTGTRMVVHTLAKGDEWATTEFVATSLTVGGKATFNTDGKICAIATSEPALFEVLEIESAANYYADKLITVRVL